MILYEVEVRERPNGTWLPYTTREKLANLMSRNYPNMETRIVVRDLETLQQYVLYAEK